jgi:RNA polymerase sigma-70 factor (ECF subfamily)
MSTSREQAEDLFQETFKRAHEKAHTLRGNRFKPWLFSIATRLAIDSFRKQNRRPRVISLNQKTDYDSSSEELGATVVANNSPDPSEEMIKVEQKKQIRRTIELLPPKQRATIALAYYQQMTYREVAEVLCRSIGTVKTQMYRALRTLEQKLPDISGDAE